MKKCKIFFVVVCIFPLIWGCLNKKDSKYNEIKTLEEEVFSMKMLDKAKGSVLIDSYAAYALEYPKDSATAGFLFKAGDIAMNMGMGNKAVAFYDKVMTMFPEFEKAPESLFLKAFVYENQMGDLKQSEKFYKQFIAKYPEHALVKDARASLVYLGKSPEELIKLFQEKNK